MRHELIQLAFARKYCLAGKQKAKRAAQAVHVGALVGAIAAGRRLRGHVSHSAEYGPALGQVGYDVAVFLAADAAIEAGQAQVDDLDASVLVQQEIRRLDVAVDYPRGVRVGQSLRPLAECS